jgi:hypothetical protein
MSAGNGAIACVPLRGATDDINGVTFNSSSTGWSAGASGLDIGGLGTSTSCWKATGLSGTASVVITMSAAPAWGHPIVLVFSGVDTGTPLGTAGSAGTSGGAISIAGVVSDTNSIVVGLMYLRANDAGVACSGSGTQRYELAEATFGSTVSVCTWAGASSVTASWSGVSADAGGIAFSINGTGGAPPSTRNRMMTGIGHD